VLVPLPGAAMPAGERIAVTPLGAPLTDNVICDWNPYNAAVFKVKLAHVPGDTLALVALAVSEKVGGGKTVRLTDWVLVTPPPAAVTVRL
jgi:hypothetical protein